MKLPASLTTVTRFSKFLAIILFFTFIITGFFAGMKYQAMLDLTAYQQSNLTTVTPLPTPTCRPRPACLDSIPRCMIPETSNMCPRITPTPAQGIACPMIAKLCPDGKTYVGRTGPKCEFAACPNF